MTDLPRVLVHNSETDKLQAWLRAAVPDVICAGCNSYDGFAAMVESFRPDVVYSVRFAGTQGYPRDALFASNGPRWLANGGAGTDHLGDWDPARTVVTNTAGVAADMMAEYVIGGFLHFTLDVPGLQQDKAGRIWRAERMVRPLAGRTLLVVGLGHTGRAVAARAKAFGMRVLGTRARPHPTAHVDEVHASGDLLQLLPRADFIAVATPLLPATQGLIGREKIAAMKPGIILADVSRGGVVDQSALHDALQTGHVAGAALDVFETEPLPEASPLWSLDNVLISPHCSAVHADWEKASFDLFLGNLDRWIRGEDLINIVDPARGY
jgi:phosphoglycerate dehydrogenase-like enzyme